MSICTKCGYELESYNYCGIEFNICRKCNTVIISIDNINLLIKKIDPNAITPDLFALAPVTINEAYRKCSFCGTNMDKIIYEGVIIDRCNNCKLLLFDNGELSKYFSKISKLPVEIMSNTMFIKTYCQIENKTNIKQPVKKIINKEKEVVMQIQSKEKEIVFNPINGFFMMLILLLLILFTICLIFNAGTIPFAIPLAIACIVFLVFSLGGFIIIKPQEAYVLTLFGNYVGTIKKAGFYWKNPLISTVGEFGNATISLKARTLNNEKQKINDEEGNPIEVGIMVTWEVKDSAMAVFNVDNYVSFLSAQCDSVLRKIIRQYPYDAPEDSGKETLRGDNAEISEKLKIEIQNAVMPAGLHIIDAKITHLAYASEIAVAMLQRQQANAVIAARTAIVNGAVGMVEMALNKLSQNDNLSLSDADKAKMVNNLLVVLCGNKESQPVIQM